MDTNIGLWIDHRNAFIVVIEHINIARYKLVKSKAEKQLRRSDGIHANVAYESQLVPPDDKKERKFTKQLDSYYDNVIDYMRDTKAKLVFIFGPGEAKGELMKRLKKNKIFRLENLENVENADKMTDLQILAKVQKHFINK